MKNLSLRLWVILGTVLFATYLLIPSFLKFGYGKQIPKITRAEDPWYYGVLPSETLKLGLDLMGGLHLVLGIDFNEVNRDAVTKLKNQLKEVVEREKIEGVTYDITPNQHIVVTFPNEGVWKQVDKLVGRDLGHQIDFEGQTGNSATLRMTQTYEDEVHKRAVDQSMETLRNRIDEFGIAEPIIQRQGDEKILVQFPGVQEPGRLKEIIARTAKLQFQVVASGPEEPGGSPTPGELQNLVDSFVKTKALKLDVTNPITKYSKELNAFAAAKLPKGTELLFQKKTNVNTREAEYVPYLLQREALITGEDLQDAYMGFNQQTNEPIVNFQLTPLGAGKFERATGENVGKHMAIVLDANVHSAPRIKQKIGGGHAMIEMGGTGRSQQEINNDAKDTALVLRSGALPARLEFLEERVLGPSLGRDAIRAGSISLIAGLMLVMIFMVVYYRLSGLIATLALFLNGVLVLAAMAAFEGTLTLPGLAGLTLTLGMAIDANVLIFEHVREELRLGKSWVTATAEGYHRAFSAIIDGHLTSIISGVVLLSFGYGPIRGFAVTLLIGLSASLFTSVYVTRAVFDYFILKRHVKHFSV